MTTGVATVAVANGWLNAIRASGTTLTVVPGTYARLCAGDPGSAGTSNGAAGDTSRQAFTQAAASSGSIAISGTNPTWTNGGTTEPITHIAVFTASTSGTFLYSTLLSGTAVGGSVTIGTSGVLTTGSAHGLSVGDAVSLDSVVTSTGIVAGTAYYVITVGSSTTATLSATAGGSALTTTSGTGTNLRQLPKWVSGNTFSLTGLTVAVTPLAA